MSYEMKDARARPRLLNTPVPWMISPSAPMLKLRWRESGNIVHIDFVAYFKQFEQFSNLNRSEIRYASDPGSFVESQDQEKSPYRLVRVAFENSTFVRIQPSHSDREVINESAYDWSGVPGKFHDSESIEEFLSRTNRLWSETGICPDSGMYKVEDPNFNKAFDLNETDLHYFLLGYDSYIEIVAQKWNWQKGQPLVIGK